MKGLWTLIDGLNMGISLKTGLFLGLLTLIWLLAGGALWLIIGSSFAGGTQGLLCFMGYPAVFPGFFGGILYLLRHDFS